jgi:hypothetical protein
MGLFHHGSNGGVFSPAASAIFSRSCHVDERIGEEKKKKKKKEEGK